MKKSLLFVLALALWATSAFAVSVEVSPQATTRFYEDVDTALGAGVTLDVKGVFPAVPLVLMNGIEFISTEEDGIDGDAVTASVGLGYDFSVAEDLTIRPYMSLDFALIDVDGSLDATDNTGHTFGVRGIYDVNDRVSLFVGLGYQWMETTLSSPVASQKVDLDNFNLSSGLSIRF